MALDFQQTDTAATFGSIAACSGLAAGSVNDNVLCEVGGTTGTTEIVATHDGSGSGILRLIHFELDVPVDTGWDAGDWTVRLNVTTTSSQLIWQQLYICRVDSGGTNQETIASATGIGVKMNVQFPTHTIAGGAQTPNAGDRVYIVLGFDNGQTMSNTVGVTPSELISSPFTAGATPVTIQASPATLTAVAQAVTPNLAALAVQASPASLSAAAQVTDPQVASGGSVIFSDDWTGTNGDPWDTNKWTTDFVNAAGVEAIDIQANEGRMYMEGTNSGMRARALASTDSSATDQEMLIKARGVSNQPQTYFWLRHSGTWNNFDPTTGYGVYADFSGSGYELLLANSGVSTLVSTSRTWGMNTDWWFRFRVEGDQIKVRAWQDGNTEPETWDLEDTDATLSGPGRLGIVMRRGGGDPNENRVDDLTLEDLAAAGGVTVQASPATLTVAAQAASPQQTALTVSASPASIATAAQTVTLTVAPVAIQAAPATLTTAAQTTNPTQAAFTTQASPASLTAAAQTVNPTVSGAPVTVQAAPATTTTAAQTVTSTQAALTVTAASATLTTTGQQASPQQAALAVSADPATTTATASVVSPQVTSQGVTVQAAPAILTASAEVVTPTTAALTVQAAPATITATGQATQPSVAGEPVVIQATPVSVTTAAQTADVIRAGLAIQADPAIVLTTAQTFVPAFDALVLQAVAATVDTSASAVLGIEGEKRKRLEGSGVLAGSTEGSKTGAGFLEGSKV